MKFGKRIRLLAKSEWYEEYVDYKSLKQVIKGEFPLAKKGEEVPVEETPFEHRQRFIKRVNSQLHRASKFYVSQTAIVRGRLEDLKGALEQVNTARDAALLISEELNLTPSTPKAVLPTPPSDALEPVNVEPPSSGIGAAAPPAISAEPLTDAQVAARDSSPQNKPQGSNSHLRAVRDMIQQIAEEVEDLKEFARLNCVAASKIGKKWDKRHVFHVAQARSGPEGLISPGKSSVPESAASAAAGHASPLDGDEPGRAVMSTEDMARASAEAPCDPTHDAPGDVHVPLRPWFEAKVAASAMGNTKALVDAEHMCLEFMQSAGALSVHKKKGARAKLKESADAAASGRSVAIGALTDIPVVQRLRLGDLPTGITRLRVALGCNPLSEPVTVPVIVVKGATSGPVLGITSALHGNELNGIPVIHKVVDALDPENMVGTVVAIPVANPGGYVRYQRGFSDGVDLNRIMPGKKAGSCSQAFAHKLLQRVIYCMDYLLDLHTASFGRVNSLYIRSDMTINVVRRLSLLQNPQIIVHNTGPDGSLRAAAGEMGVHTLTVEIGNPQRFSQAFIDRAVTGVLNTAAFLNISPREIVPPKSEPVVCARSFWMFTRAGGVLYVFPAVNTWVHKGQVIAEVRSIYGDLVDRHVAPQDGVVVGKSENPVCQSGDRILHLGVHDSVRFAAEAHDGH